ncbi:hypothetical protein RFI_13718, partial [Reticulomyxa filosa]
ISQLQRHLSRYDPDPQQTEGANEENEHKNNGWHVIARRNFLFDRNSARSETYRKLKEERPNKMYLGTDLLSECPDVSFDIVIHNEPATTDNYFIKRIQLAQKNRQHSGLTFIFYEESNERRHQQLVTQFKLEQIRYDSFLNFFQKFFVAITNICFDYNFFVHQVTIKILNYVKDIKNNKHNFYETYNTHCLKKCQIKLKNVCCNNILQYMCHSDT